MGARIGRSLVLLSFFTLFGCSSTTVNPGGPEKGGTSYSGGGGSSASGGSAGSTSGGSAGSTSGGSAGSTSGGGGAAGSGLAPANLGQAIMWNGDCSTRGYADSASVAFDNAEAFTVEFWYRIEPSTALVEGLVNKGGKVGTPGWAISIAKNADIYTFTLCTTGDAIPRVCRSATRTLAVSQNFHLAVSHEVNAGSYELYVLAEGEPKHSPTEVNDLPTNWTVPEEFEVSSCSSQPAYGTMDALMIWKVARTQAELDSDAYADQNCSDSNLAVSYDFETITDNKIQDCKGSSLYVGLSKGTYKLVLSPFDAQ